MEGHWCRLRHLGARRAEQLVAVGSARQRLRDLLECAWPAVLSAAADPLDALTWRAAMAVSTDPGRIVAMGFGAFADAALVARKPQPRRPHIARGEIGPGYITDRMRWLALPESGGQAGSGQWFSPGGGCEYRKNS